MKKLIKLFLFILVIWTLFVAFKFNQSYQSVQDTRNKILETTGGNPVEKEILDAHKEFGEKKEQYNKSTKDSQLNQVQNKKATENTTKTPSKNIAPSQESLDKELKELMEAQ